ncbi:MAG: hypothetical protein M1819_004580 [Sarea resinae]|nr:MAG: hypothetical protein M1819_006816 [Sarea resinae]KAI9832036.1 MAG: hypothetical protein M1819_004580 [Sarea resinae]
MRLSSQAVVPKVQRYNSSAPKIHFDTDAPPLLDAVRSGDCLLVDSLIQSGASVDERDAQGRTALMQAVKGGRKDISEILLENGAEVNAKSTYGRTVMMEAAQAGSLDMVMLLIKNGAEVNAEGRFGETPLMEAARAGSPDLVMLLLENSAEVNAKNVYGGTALIEAARAGSPDVVMLLLKNGAEVDAKSVYGGTALIEAARAGSPDVVKLLLKNGAEVNAESRIWGTARIEAARAGSPDVVKLLLKNGAEVNAQSAEGDTALIEAIRAQNLEILNILLQKGAVVNTVSELGTSALIEATRTQNLKIVNILLEKGASVDTKTFLGKIVLKAAADTGSEEILRVLIKNSADVNARSAVGTTALMEASHVGSDESVKLSVNEDATPVRDDVLRGQQDWKRRQAEEDARPFRSPREREREQTRITGFSPPAINRDDRLMNETYGEEGRSGRNAPRKHPASNPEQPLETNSNQPSFNSFNTASRAILLASYPLDSAATHGSGRLGIPTPLVYASMPPEEHTADESRNGSGSMPLHRSISGSVSIFTSDSIHSEVSEEPSLVESDDSSTSNESSLENTPDSSRSRRINVDNFGTPETARPPRQPLPEELEQDERLTNPASYFSRLERLEASVFKSSGLSHLWKFPTRKPTRRDASETLSKMCPKIDQGGWASLPGSVRGWFTDLLESHNIMSKLMANIERMRGENFCVNSINTIVVDSRRSNLASLCRISIDQIANLCAEFEAIPDEIFEQGGLDPFVSNSAMTSFDLRLGGSCLAICKPLGLPLGEIMKETWRLTPLILDLAIISYCGAHIERFDEAYIQQSLDYFDLSDMVNSSPTSSNKHIIFHCRRLRCLDEFLGGRAVWTFESTDSDLPQESLPDLYLGTDIQEFADVWGPVWSNRGLLGRDNQIYRTGGGYILPWPTEQDSPGLEEEEIFCHWITGKTAICQQWPLAFQNFELLKHRLIIGSGSHRLKENRACKLRPENIRQQLKSRNCLWKAGTSNSVTYKESQAVQGQIGGMGISTGFSMTYKRRHGNSLKQALVDKWANKPGTQNPRELENWYGLEVSACTGNARRRRLVEIIGSTIMIRSLHFALTVSRSSPWMASFIEATTSSDYMAFSELYEGQPEWREELGKLVSHCLDFLADTGTDANQSLSAFWVDKAYIEYLAVFYRSSHSWTGMLNDTREICTMAILTETCLELPHCSGANVCGAPFPLHCSPSVRRTQGNPILETYLEINEQAPMPPRLRRSARRRNHWDTSELSSDARFPLRNGRLGVLRPLRHGKVLMEWMATNPKVQEAKEMWRQGFLGRPLEPCHWEGMDADDEARVMNRIMVFVMGL